MEEAGLFNKLVSSSTSTVKNSKDDAKHNVTSWSDDMQGLHKHVLNDTASWHTKTAGIIHKVHTCLVHHHFKNEELKTVGELSEVCEQTVLKCVLQTRIGRPDI